MKKKNKKHDNAPEVSISYRDTSIEEIPAEDLRTALLPLHEYCKPQDEMIATAEATYELIRCADMDLQTKNAFYRLEKQFNFFKELVEK